MVGLLTGLDFTVVMLDIDSDGFRDPGFALWLSACATFVESFSKLPIKPNDIFSVSSCVEIGFPPANKELEPATGLGRELDSARVGAGRAAILRDGLGRLGSSSVGANKAEADVELPENILLASALFRKRLEKVAIMECAGVPRSMRSRAPECRSQM
jgi:hypothetical protein